MKKKWIKPELVVIVKGRPEEAILATCRTSGSMINPGNATFQNCSTRARGGCAATTCDLDNAT
jgi:hypothetical protein